ncbi:MAG: LacI family DNA-binding transcriptional regulator [Actinomyces sp.]|uniref:LacI family DNA-binding transcriptional regulator n=1 Tax=Actinomyces sp. TaxID=29317 RepID=UPI0026DAF9B0|nr:LacI family DNA-binding transcriptional regulator [Actinomyces sp.]MDO4242377.1 LacI family DNA-binding transcriptional regulator [Actinomyces sp.]
MRANDTAAQDAGSRGRATIADVARLAGVSKATVSRVLNGSPRVAPVTRRAVEEAIATSGYVESWQAKSLATGRAGAIGVILTEPFDEVYSDPTFAAVLRGVYDGLAPTPLVPVLLQASSGPERAKAMRFLEQRGADAVIHLTPYVEDGLLPQLAAQGLPTVLTGRVEEAAGMSSVFSDDVLGAAMAARRAAEQGRRRPLIVVGPRDNPASRERVEGYLSVLCPAAPDPPPGTVVFGGWDEAAGEQVVRRALTDGVDFDIVLAGSDRIARGALHALGAHGLSVPRDVAVIGFDNHPVSQLTHPALTTVAQPLREEGRVAVELALELLAGAAPRVEVLPMHLVVRESG